jgi:hypothetical protein
MDFGISALLTTKNKLPMLTVYKNDPAVKLSAGY